MTAEAGAFVRATVRRVIEETAQCRSFEFDLPEEGRASFDARPGQFVTLRVAIDGARHERCYSLSSVAALGEAPRVTIKRVGGAGVSAWCNERLAQGSAVEVGPPAGQFFVRPGDGPLLFAAAGSGVTPIFAMLRAALHQTERPVTLLYVNRRESEAIFLRELRRLRDAHASRMILTEIHSDGTTPTLDVALAGCVEANADADVYVCGPAGFMDRVARAAEDAGVSPDRIYMERFVAEAPVADAAPPIAASAAASAADVVARIGGVEHAFRCAEGATLLEAALAAGVAAPSSCREGHCGACITALRDGAVESAPGAALSKRDRLKGRILACRAKPTSSKILIDYDF